MNKSRRLFFSTGLGLLGLAGVVEAASKVTNAESIKQHAPDGRNVVHLLGNTDEPSEYQNRVGMSVGTDNRLWINYDGSWKRVTVEGEK